MTIKTRFTLGQYIVSLTLGHISGALYNYLYAKKTMESLFCALEMLTENALKKNL